MTKSRNEEISPCSEAPIEDVRQQILEQVLAKQDESFRWGFDAKRNRVRHEYWYYSPNFKSTLWTLVLLADIESPTGIPQIGSAIRLIADRFFDLEHGIFRLPGESHFPIPCLNGNMIYVLNYFKSPTSSSLDRAISFFDAHQRFDDGDFKTPASYPYHSNKSCYGKHTCYWGVTKLLKGVSFIPKKQRSKEARRLVENCIEFVLHHEVCFGSHRRAELLHKDIGTLTFPCFYKSDFLEVLWLLAREKVRDRRVLRALDLLQARMKDGGFWELEKPANTIVSVGQKNMANVFITERANQVLRFYER